MMEMNYKSDKVTDVCRFMVIPVQHSSIFFRHKTLKQNVLFYLFKTTVQHVDSKKNASSNPKLSHTDFRGKETKKREK